MSSSKAEPEIRSWVQKSNLEGESQEARERGWGSKQGNEKRKYGLCEQLCSSLPGPVAEAFIHCSLMVEGGPSDATFP